MSNTYISTPTWTLVNTTHPFMQQVISDVTGQNLVATDGTLIYVSSDYGTTFSNGSTINNSGYFIISIAANALLSFIVVTAPSFSGNVSPDYIYRSTDYGSTFSPLTNSPIAIWQCITSSATGQYLVAGQSDSLFLKLYYSTNYGTDWTQCNGTDDCYWSSVVSSSDGSKVVAMGTNSQTNVINIFTSNDYGENFTNMGLIAENIYFNQMACNATGQYIFVTAGQNGIYVSSDYGVTWTLTGANIANNESYYAINISSTGQYILTSDNSTSSTYFSTDYGNTWTKTNESAGNLDYQSIAVSGTGEYQTAVASFGPMYSSTRCLPPRLPAAAAAAACSTRLGPMNPLLLPCNSA